VCCGQRCMRFCLAYCSEAKEWKFPELAELLKAVKPVYGMILNRFGPLITPKQTTRVVGLSNKEKIKAPSVY